jgi:hypothetical protein
MVIVRGIDIPAVGDTRHGHLHRLPQSFIPIAVRQDRTLPLLLNTQDANRFADHGDTPGRSLTTPAPGALRTLVASIGDTCQQLTV